MPGARLSRVLLVPPSPARLNGLDHMMADFEIVRNAAAHGPRGPHELEDDPEAADVILFVGSRHPLHRDIRSHPLARRFPRRVVVYDSSDWVIPFFPGIYPSIQKRYYRSDRIWSGFYLRWSAAETISFTDPETVPRFLYGFVGSAATHDIRRRVLALRRSDALLRNTDKEPGRDYGQPQHVYDSYRAAYGNDLASVRFVLCPRGVGPGSMRVFEAMKAGRVPVIISDEWVEPEGPAWSSFSLRVRERDVEAIPRLLESTAAKAPEMGQRARAAWEDWFSPNVAFRSIATRATELTRTAWAIEWRSRKMAALQTLRWHSLRHYVAGPTGRRLLGLLRRG